MRDNRGITLVEILVAVFISAIVLSGIAYFLFTTIKMYNRNGATVELQNEAQTTLNHIVDETMQANGLILQYADVTNNGITTTQTDVMMFGRLQSTVIGGNTVFIYSGTVMITDLAEKEIYLATFPNEKYVDTRPSMSADYRSAVTVDGYEYAGFKTLYSAGVPALLSEIKNYVLNGVDADAVTLRTSCLMASNVTSCSVVPTAGCVSIDLLNPDQSVFVSPMSVDIKITFEKEYGTGTVARSVTDQAAVRNKLGSIIVNGVTCKPSFD